MEKKLYDLKIDPELRDYIPRLTDQELELLTDSILEEGCNEPLTTWNGVIVDGHNRYRICKEHGIPFAVEEREFENKDKAMFWMMRRQLGRRNLRPFQRCELIYPLEQSISEEIERRRRLAISRYRSGSETSSDVDESEDTGKLMAHYADVSRTTWYMAKTLIEKGSDAIKEKLRNADMAISTAYNQIQKPDNRKKPKQANPEDDKNKEKTEEERKPKQENPEEEGNNTHENTEEKPVVVAAHLEKPLPFVPVQAGSEEAGAEAVREETDAEAVREEKEAGREDTKAEREEKEAGREDTEEAVKEDAVIGYFRELFEDCMEDADEILNSLTDSMRNKDTSQQIRRELDNFYNNMIKKLEESL